MQETSELKSTHAASTSELKQLLQSAMEDRKREEASLADKLQPSSGQVAEVVNP